LIGCVAVAMVQNDLLHREYTNEQCLFCITNFP